MNILQLALLGQPVLRQRSEEVSPSSIREPGFQGFLEDLLTSMLFHDGVGLAAPQVFRSERVIAVGLPASAEGADEAIEPFVIINPVIEVIDPTEEEDWEGCLSLGDLRGRVPRARGVKVRGLDRDGRKLEKKLSGFPARVVQHEVDHLDGVIFPDRMKDLSSLGFARELERRWIDSSALDGLEDEG